MYAHLELRSVNQSISAGYLLNGTMTFGYGDITIDTETVFPEDADYGTISLRFYRSDKSALLPGGMLPDGDATGDKAAAITDNAETLFLRKILPPGDLAYLLSLFGLIQPGDLYENRTRVLVETPKARKHKFYDRLEVLFTQDVNREWLREYGHMFGCKAAKK